MLTNILSIIILTYNIPNSYRTYIIIYVNLKSIVSKVICHFDKTEYKPHLMMNICIIYASKNVMFSTIVLTGENCMMVKYLIVYLTDLSACEWVSALLHRIYSRVLTGADNGSLGWLFVNNRPAVLSDHNELCFKI